MLYLSTSTETSPGLSEPGDLPAVPQLLGAMHTPAGAPSRKAWRQMGYKVRDKARAVAVQHNILDAPAVRPRIAQRYDPVAVAADEWLAEKGAEPDRLTTVQERELDQVREEARRQWGSFVVAFRDEVATETLASITEAQFDTYLLLHRAGHIVEVPLYAPEDCDPFNLDDLNQAAAWEVLLTDFYRQGSHPFQFIAKYQDSDGEWKSGTVGTGKVRIAWDTAKHRKGEVHLGVKAGRKTSFAAIDVDRHSGKVPGHEHEHLVMQVWDHVAAVYAFMAPVLEINPKNGSTKVFLHFEDFAAVDGYAQAFIARLREELPFLKGVEVYPSISGDDRKCSQVFLPFRFDKVSLCDRVVPQVRSIRYDRERRSIPYEAYDPKYILKWLADPKRSLADRDLVLGVLRRAIANMPDVIAEKDASEEHQAAREPSKVRQAATGRAGDLPPWKGCTASRLVCFLSGEWLPPDDTLDEFVVVLLRVLYHMGWSEDDAVAWIEDAIDELPDTSFSDRLTNNLAEWCRNLRQTASTVWNGNGGQPDPQESSRKLFEMLGCWAARGFDITNRSTWDRASEASPRRLLPVCWTAALEELLVGFSTVLKTRDLDAVRKLFEAVASQVEVRKQLAVSYFRILMKEAGIPGGMDKAKAARDFLESQGILRLFKRSFNDKASGTRRGNLYVLGSLVRFNSGDEAQSGSAGLLLLVGSPHQPNGSIYPSSLLEAGEELVMERRRLSAERWYDGWLRQSCRRKKQVA